MRQRQWIELLKDYECMTDYHTGKANVVADALSRRNCSSSTLARMRISSLKEVDELRKTRSANEAR